MMQPKPASEVPFIELLLNQPDYDNLVGLLQTAMEYTDKMIETGTYSAWPVDYVSTLKGLVEGYRSLLKVALDAYDVGHKGGRHSFNDESGGEMHGESC